MLKVLQIMHMMCQVDTDTARKALVTLVIEKRLLGIGRSLYDAVLTNLKEEYNCYLPDCYEHPEYLTEILKKLYGNAYRTIGESFNEQLEGISHSRPVARFLEVISN
jgi:hypothetical protein